MVRNISARVFLIRHGETSWSVGGKHASFTDVPMSREGERQVEETRDCYIGRNKLIDPENVVRIYVCPQQRTKRTVEILELGVQSQQNFLDRDDQSKTVSPLTGSQGASSEPMIQATSWLNEWNYGEYEGLSLAEISARRPQSPDWVIWKDGCPGGEAPEQITTRLDELIAEIRQNIEKSVTEWPGGLQISHATRSARDIVCVGHGHILAALALRWVGMPLDHGMRLLMEPSSVAVLSFENDDLGRPAISLGRRMMR
ncbi:phosphoglycerate mutase family protein [Aspergillus ruber CBS 135680]|uniref:Phosphoglycerate mutase family protein n=1 Tax=Aspergillus ruber (strain CBS 135680) TaxID=1388766 RepID=A0A017SEN4_ASPRC|nr:phosphoglycerate mutase family protein [Aspergillus ruber CBS 135680]EYE95064.1 phosphoglycerate mutase family protein [Aspergillus ruber CBS 135680]